MPENDTLLMGTYDASYVALSLCVATIAAYVALLLAARVTQSRGRGRYLWLFGGANVMGIGIWGMHFTGMLALQLPIAVSYDLPVVALSLVVASATSGIALSVVSRPTMSPTLWLVGGTLMGGGIATMHYIGMAAMRMSARPRWDAGIVMLSLFVAIVVSLIALRLVFALRTVAEHRFAWRRVGAAGVMGVAVAGMHYTGMAAATFISHPEMKPVGFFIGRGAILGCIIFIGGVLTLVFVGVVAGIQRRWSDRDRAFADQQRYFRTVVANAPVGLIALDGMGRIVVAEGRDLRPLGYAPEAMIGQLFAGLYADVPALLEQAARALAGEAFAANASVGGKVLETRWTPLFDDAGAVASVIAVGTDISERRSAELALRHRLLHDPLTNLPNRTALNERLATLIEGARERNETFALAFIDLNRFKEVNDTLGHDVGDALLKNVSQRVDRCLTTIGILDGAMRLGGDEFALLLPSVDRTRATEIANHVLRDIARPHLVGEHILDVHASLGLAMYPEHALDAQTLLRCADVAMYVAKRGGFGCAVYDAAQDRHSPERLALEAQMRQAIVSGGFELYYQPQVDIVSGRIGAVEALIRWEHPTRGRLMPDEFIPLAEETGFIVPLTQWVLAEALRQAACWAADGIVLSVSINASMRGLRDTALPATVAALLQRYGLPPDRLVIEVTESVVMADDEQTRSVFQELADLGIVLSIDDFGTGYSSLAYLRQLPVTELKIDKSFVLALGEADSKAGELVRLISNLGHNLGLRVVAEGVESEEIFEFLAAAGCDIAQGYFISRPVPADALRALLSSTWPTENARAESASLMKLG